jgi:replication factor C subunit 1
LQENPGAKAVLLSGPPGIGKTSVATLGARQVGYEVLELNASYTRYARSVTEQLSDVVLTKTMTSTETMGKRLVIMDEVDGMGGSDRGGIPELIKVIKTSKNPIICICNDRQSQKIRSLANHCYDLRVRRPTKSQIANRMIAIAKGEGLDIETNAAELLVEQVGNDIRQVLNTLQMWRAQSTHMKYTEIRDRLKTIEKDKVLRQTPFDACLSILGGSKNASLDERYNSFFIDYSLLPLMIQHNYIDSAKSGIFRSDLDEGVKMDQLALV